MLVLHISPRISFYSAQVHWFLLSKNAVYADNLLTVSIYLPINMEKSLYTKHHI